MNRSWALARFFTTMHQPYDPAGVAIGEKGLTAYQRALIPMQAPWTCPKALRLAAVLLGLCDWWGPEGYLLAIRRAGALRNHAGQVGFPGGKLEPQDEGPAMAALRESHEEIGLEAARVHLLGRLSPVPTPTGFWVLPFVGVVDTRDWQPCIDPGEVDELLRLPKKALCDPQNYEYGGRVSRNDVSYVRHAYHVCSPALWGASAHMLHELLERFASVPGASQGSQVS